MRALYGESILRPLSTQAGLFVRVQSPDSLRTENPNRIRCLQAQYTIFVYKFRAAFWTARYKLSATNRGCLQVGYSSTFSFP